MEHSAGARFLSFHTFTSFRKTLQFFSWSVQHRMKRLESEIPAILVVSTCRHVCLSQSMDGCAFLFLLLLAMKSIKTASWAGIIMTRWILSPREIGVRRGKRNIFLPTWYDYSVDRFIRGIKILYLAVWKISSLSSGLQMPARGKLSIFFSLPKILELSYVQCLQKCW